jgi:hypothetical protein
VRSRPGLFRRFDPARRSPDGLRALSFGCRNAVVAPERQRGNTVPVPECPRSCKQVAGKLQACCRLV